MPHPPNKLVRGISLLSHGSLKFIDTIHLLQLGMMQREQTDTFQTNGCGFLSQKRELLGIVSSLAMGMPPHSCFSIFSEHDDHRLDFEKNTILSHYPLVI